MEDGRYTRKERNEERERERERERDQAHMYTRRTASAL